MQDHTNYRPAKCDLCDKSFKNKQDLASHIRCHKDIRKYMCDVCGKRFRSQSHMAYHRYAHFDERNFHCDQCEQKFKSPHILRTHKNTVHSTVFRYECETCGRKFKRDHHLVVGFTFSFHIDHPHFHRDDLKFFFFISSSSHRHIGAPTQRWVGSPELRKTRKSHNSSKCLNLLKKKELNLMSITWMKLVIANL